MKKNVLRVAQAALILAVGFSACKKDELTNRESEAIRLTNTVPDSLNKDVEYTVNLVDASTANFVGKTAADFTGAVITAAQGGNVSTMTAGADGMVVFQGMQKGAMSVNIQMEGFATVDYTVGVASGYQGNLIPMIPTTGDALASISGTVYLDTDMTNKTKETAPDGTVVFAIPAVGASDLGTAINAAGFTAFAYDGLSMSTTTTGGEYTIDVPAAADEIEYELKVPHFKADQSVIVDSYNGNDDMPSLQTIATTFGTGINATMKTGINGDEDITAGAYITFDAPNSSITQSAVLVAIVNDQDYVKDAVITSNGSDYSTSFGTDGSFSFSIENTSTNPEASNATISFDVDGTTGRVDNIEVTGGGLYWDAAPSISIPYELDAFEGAIATITAGNDAFVTISNEGSYLTDYENIRVKVEGANVSSSDITNITYAGNGNNTWGAQGTLDLVFPGSPNGFWIANAGSYSIGDNVTLNVLATDEATGETVLSTGELTELALSTPGIGYPINSTLTVAITGGGGTGATAEAYTNNEGFVTSTQITDPGNGFTSNPNAEILVPADVAGETAKGSLLISSEGKITGIDWDTQGSGYKSIPNYTVTSFVTGTGSGVDFEIILNGDAIDYVLLNGGSGYSEFANNGSFRNADANVTAPVTTGGSVIQDIDLGSGKRTIEE